jgi:hypothetical protein
VARYEIYIRDSFVDRFDVVRNFSKLEMTVNYNDVGGWILEMPYSPNDRSVQSLLTARSQGGGLGGILVVRDGQIIFSGPVKGFELSGNWVNSSEGEKIVFFGTDDNGILATRLSMPPPYKFQATSVGWDTQTSNAENVLIALAENNIANAPDERYVDPFVTNTSNNQGSTITLRSRYENLLDKMKEAAIAGGLGFRVIQNDIFIEFQVYSPADKTSSVVFSKERKNLASYRYRTEAPTANSIIVAGQNAGTARGFRYIRDTQSQSFYGTLESFLDRRDTNVTAELDQAGQVELQDKDEATVLEIQPLEVPKSQFMKDYNVGDKVTIQLYDQKIQDIIRGVTITLTKENGEEIVPSVQSSGATPNFHLFDQYKNLASRVRKLETI